MRPAKLTYLRTGKAIGSQEHVGFCDTFNWLVDFCKNLRGDGLYITVDNKFGDIPTINFTPTTDYGTGGGGSTPVSGYTGSISVLTGVTIASDFSAIVFETKNLVYESGLLSSVTAGTPITLGAQVYGNVNP